jgi:hypothetical protein
MLLEHMDGQDSSTIPIHMVYMERSAAATPSAQRHSYTHHKLLQSLEMMLGPDVTSNEEDI